MRTRDILMFVVVGVAVLLSLEEQGSLSLTTTWVRPIDTNLFSNQHYPLTSERIPNPIVTDLDGDGVNEVIVVTREPHIEILDPTSGMTPTVKHSATLLSSVKVTSSRQPVAVATGYLDKKGSGGGPRHQVIVVVTQGWSVLCFDSSLNLLWESTVPEELPPYFYQREVAILISDLPIYDGDEGSVVVGGRLDAEETLDTAIAHNGDQPEPVDVFEIDEAEAAGEQAFKDQIEEKGDENERHFNYYAFEGRTGALRWHHQADDFQNPQATETRYPQHNFKKDIKAHTRDSGEVSWRVFAGDVLEALPHRWTSREDTKFSLARFERSRANRIGGGDAGGGAAGVGDYNAQAAGLEHHLSNLLGDPLADEHDHIDKANVVVVHLEGGLEVVHLFTGRTLCRLAMAGATYADINDDGVIEHVQAITDTSGAARPIHSRRKTSRHIDEHCYARVDAGMPPVDPVFNGSICDVRKADFFNVRKSKREDSGRVRSIDPIVVPKDSALTGSHLKEYDSVFFTSNGLVTSFGPHGKRNWMVQTGAKWTPSSEEMATMASAALLDLLKEGAMVLFTSARLEVGETWEVVLAGGHQSLVILQTSGSVAATFDLPDVPVNPLVVADFDGDGWRDIILTTRGAHHGISIKPNTGNSFMIVVVVTLLLVMAAFTLFTLFESTFADEVGPSPLRARLDSRPPSQSSTAGASGSSSGGTTTSRPRTLGLGKRND